MKKNKIFIIVICLLVLVIAFLIYKLVAFKNNVNNDKPIYCVSKDGDHIGTVSFDFKNGSVYRYTVVFTNKIDENVPIDFYEKKTNETNKEHKGSTSKFWHDDETYVLAEYFQIDLLEDEDIKTLFSVSKNKFKKYTREDIIKNYAQDCEY